METVKELLEDPKIQPGMMQSALNAVTSLFTPSKTIQSAKKDGSGNPHQMSVASPYLVPGIPSCPQHSLQVVTKVDIGCHFIAPTSPESSRNSHENVAPNYYSSSDNS